jgi:hypothetical protein
MKTADCVHPPKWWKACDASGDDKCAAGWTLLPGGKGKSTLFFPKPNQRSDRDYAGMLDAAADDAAMSAARATFIGAAKQFVAAQLNFLSGARLPSVELQEAFDSVSSFLSTSSENSPLSEDQVEAVASQTDLLAQYNNGTLPSIFKAPPKCDK